MANFPPTKRLEKGKSALTAQPKVYSNPKCKFLLDEFKCKHSPEVILCGILHELQPHHCLFELLEKLRRYIQHQVQYTDRQHLHCYLTGLALKLMHCVKYIPKYWAMKHSPPILCQYSLQSTTAASFLGSGLPRVRDCLSAESRLTCGTWIIYITDNGVWHHRTTRLL